MCFRAAKENFSLSNLFAPQPLAFVDLLIFPTRTISESVITFSYDIASSDMY
jgi:hypothetical protein